ncbi:MAG: rRNA maturation RNase YbeY [bacterium]
MQNNFQIFNKTKGKLPSLPFEAMKEKVLGAKYELSLVFTDSRQMKKLNTIYRNLEVPTDILSFPLSKTTGEIYICPSESRKMMKDFGRTYDNFIAFLFIHGLVHLKGFDHGTKMEKVEKKFRKMFKI